MVELRVVDDALLDALADDERRDAEAQLLELGVRVLFDLGRRDVIVEAAVLVVGDDQERVLLEPPRKFLLESSDLLAADGCLEPVTSEWRALEGGGRTRRPGPPSGHLPPARPREDAEVMKSGDQP